MSFGNPKTFIGYSFQTSSQVSATPFGSSPFSLFSGGIYAPMFQNPVLVGAGQTTYHTPQTSNLLAFRWNPFQNNATTSQPTARGNSTFSFGSHGEGTSTPQTPQYQTLIRPKLPFLVTLNLPNLSNPMNDPMWHNVSWPPIPIKLPLDIPKFEGKDGEDQGAHITTTHLWCSSNSLNDDSIRLRNFQRMLTNVEAK